MARTLLLCGSYSKGAPSGISLLAFESDSGALSHLRELPGAMQSIANAIATGAVAGASVAADALARP